MGADAAGATDACAVVVPVKDAGDTLFGLLESLAADGATMAFEVVLSDDGSTDGGVEAAVGRSWPFELTVLRHASPSGAGAARNRGVAGTDAELVVFVDADDEVQPGFLDAVVAPIRQDRADIVAAARDYDSLNAHLPPSAAALRGSSSAPSELEPGSGAVVSGGSGMAIRRSTFDAAHGFDERLRRREDQDLWLRAQEAGARAAFAPDAVVRVRRREETGGQLRQARSGAAYSAIFFALHPELVRARRSWARRVGWRTVLPRLPYLLVPSRRALAMGLVVGWWGRLEGTRQVRRLRRSGELGPWGAGPQAARRNQKDVGNTSVDSGSGRSTAASHARSEAGDA